VVRNTGSDHEKPEQNNPATKHNTTKTITNPSRAWSLVSTLQHKQRRTSHNSVWSTIV